MSVPPKPRQKKKTTQVIRDIKIINQTWNDLFIRDTKIMKAMFSQEPEYHFYTKSGKDVPHDKNDVKGFWLKTSIKKWIGNYEVEFYEKVFQEGNDLSVREYRYALRSISTKDDFFRFDHNCMMALIFPAQHINADALKYGKSHFVYPDDLVINLEKVNYQNMKKTFEHYIKSGVHPVSNRGKNYQTIIK